MWGFSPGRNVTEHVFFIFLTSFFWMILKQLPATVAPQRWTCQNESSKRLKSEKLLLNQLRMYEQKCFTQQKFKAKSVRKKRITAANKAPQVEKNAAKQTPNLPPGSNPIPPLCSDAFTLLRCCFPPVSGLRQNRSFSRFRQTQERKTNSTSNCCWILQTWSSNERCRVRCLIRKTKRRTFNHWLEVWKVSNTVGWWSTSEADGRMSEISAHSCEAFESNR